MIIRMLNLTTTNSGGVKKATVTAKEGGKGSTEVFNFTIIDQNVSTTVTFGADEEKDVSVTHTATGQGLVFATNQASGLTLHCWLDVDAPSSGC
jgi:hypothetical protein